MKKCILINKSGRKDLGQIEPLIQSLMHFAKQRMGFSESPKLELHSDIENSKNVLGKTAHYDPTNKTVAIYVDARHPKDILRSIAHELVHHTQNLRGDFAKIGDTGPGYAQKDPHLRGMEEEAYKTGNMCFRDWEDEHKRLQNESKRKNTTMSNLKEQIKQVFLQEDFMDKLKGLTKPSPEKIKPLDKKTDQEERARAARKGLKRQELEEDKDKTEEIRAGLQPAAHWHAHPTAEGENETDDSEPNEETIAKEDEGNDVHSASPQAKDNHKPSKGMHEMKKLEEAVRNAINSFLEESQVYEINEEELEEGDYGQNQNKPDPTRDLTVDQKPVPTTQKEGVVADRPPVEENQEELEETKYKKDDDLEEGFGPEPAPKKVNDGSAAEEASKTPEPAHTNVAEEKELKEWYGDQLFDSLKRQWAK